jgi:hypothetical protein
LTAASGSVALGCLTGTGEITMQRPSLSISIFALIVVGLIVLAGGSGYNIVTREGEADTHPIVGTWQVFLGDSPLVHGLLTHAADGTMTATDPVTTFAPP